MRRSVAILSGIASLGLVLPAAPSLAAPEAPGRQSLTGSHQRAVSRQAAKGKLRLTASFPTSYVGQGSVTVTARAKGGRGAVAFTARRKKANGRTVVRKLDTVALVHGKAEQSVFVLSPGSWRIRATYEGRKRSVTVVVVDGSVAFDGDPSGTLQDFTVHQSTAPADQRALSGVVTYDGNPPPYGSGFMHVFRDGNNDDAASPDYLGTAAIGADGRWSFTGAELFGKVQQLGPGKYTYVLFVSSHADPVDRFDFARPIYVDVVP